MDASRLISIVYPMIPALALIWAGLALGGNMIAASAKFQVDSLSTVDLLRVGRAQFAWLGRVEWGLAIALLSAGVVHRGIPIWLILATCLIFLVQQVALHPLLQARTDDLQAGHIVGSSFLHLYFIVLEGVKIALLVGVGISTLTSHSIPTG